MDLQLLVAYWNTVYNVYLIYYRRYGQPVYEITYSISSVWFVIRMVFGYERLTFKSKYEEEFEEEMFFLDQQIYQWKNEASYQCGLKVIMTVVAGVLYILYMNACTARDNFENALNLTARVVEAQENQIAGDRDNRNLLEEQVRRQNGIINEKDREIELLRRAVADRDAQIIELQRDRDALLEVLDSHEEYNSLNNPDNLERIYMGEIGISRRQRVPGLAQRCPHCHIVLWVGNGDGYEEYLALQPVPGAHNACHCVFHHQCLQEIYDGLPRNNKDFVCNCGRLTNCAAENQYPYLFQRLPLMLM